MVVCLSVVRSFGFFVVVVSAFSSFGFFVVRAFEALVSLRFLEFYRFFFVGLFLCLVFRFFVCRLITCGLVSAVVLSRFVFCGFGFFMPRFFGLFLCAFCVVLIFMPVVLFGILCGVFSRSFGLCCICFVILAFMLRAVLVVALFVCVVFERRYLGVDFVLVWPDFFWSVWFSLLWCFLFVCVVDLGAAESGWLLVCAVLLVIIVHCVFVRVALGFRLLFLSFVGFASVFFFSVCKVVSMLVRLSAPRGLVAARPLLVEGRCLFGVGNILVVLFGFLVWLWFLGGVRGVVILDFDRGSFAVRFVFSPFGVLEDVSGELLMLVGFVASVFWVFRRCWFFVLIMTLRFLFLFLRSLLVWPFL